MQEGAMEVDTAAADFRGRQEIRAAAKRWAIQGDAREKVNTAQKSAPHRDRVFLPGQRVYVRRKATTRPRKPCSLQRGRWVGPGA
eukprot:9246604-Pyramimonas_sp.AAC.1